MTFFVSMPSKEPNHFSAATRELIYNSTVSANQLRGATGTAIAYTPPRSIAHCKQHRAQHCTELCTQQFTFILQHYIHITLQYYRVIF